MKGSFLKLILNIVSKNSDLGGDFLKTFMKAADKKLK